MFEVERRMYNNESIEGNDEIPANIEEEINIVDQVINDIGTNDYRVMDWKNNPGEHSRRVYE